MQVIVCFLLMGGRGCLASTLAAWQRGVGMAVGVCARSGLGV